MATARKKLSDDERLARLIEKQRQIAAQVERVRSRAASKERKLDARRKIVVGAAVLAHIEHDPNFRAALCEALDKAVTRPLDRQLLADLLG